MSKEFKPLKLENLNLSSEEMIELVEGAQKFTPLLPDPEDEEPLRFVDTRAGSETL